MSDHEDQWLAMATPANDDPGAPLKGQTEFAQWMHNPLTKAFFGFLDDQETNFTQVLTELFILGRVSEDSTREDQNPHVWRGRILALRDLQRITLAEIGQFYREKREDHGEGQ